MRDLSKTDLLNLDYAALSPSEREAVRWEAIRRAESARAELLLQFPADLGAALHALRDMLTRVIREAVENLKTRRRMRAEFVELKILDDRALLDIGLTRRDVAGLGASRVPHQPRQSDATQ